MASVAFLLIPAAAIAIVVLVARDVDRKHAAEARLRARCVCSECARRERWPNE